MKWSHFEDEKGNEFKIAAIDGYWFKDRLLEGVIINITIEENGTLSAKVKKEAEKYFSNLNEEKLYQEAIKFSSEQDLFLTEDDNGDLELILISEEGKRNIDYFPTPTPFKVELNTFKDLNH